jgi:hypothetical protein
MSWPDASALHSLITPVSIPEGITFGRGSVVRHWFVTTLEAGARFKKCAVPMSARIYDTTQCLLGQGSVFGDYP